MVFRVSSHPEIASYHFFTAIKTWCHSRTNNASITVHELHFNTNHSIDLFS